MSTMRTHSPYNVLHTDKTGRNVAARIADKIQVSLSTTVSILKLQHFFFFKSRRRHPAEIFTPSLSLGCILHMRILVQNTQQRKLLSNLQALVSTFVITLVDAKQSRMLVD